MKRISLVAFSLAMFCCGALEAEVIFLPKAAESVGRNNSAPDNTTNNCEADGYTYTSCENGALALPCPSNSSYYKVCCPDGYKYTVAQCPDIASRSTDHCFGYYKCSTPNL